MHLKIIIITIMLFLSSLSTHASSDTIRIKTVTTIENGNWYPLGIRDMKAAAVDTALAQLTNSGRFIISDHDDTDASIHFSISLLGPAEIVKLTIAFSSETSANYIATVSQEVSNLDHQGIYHAFEYIGKEAALQLVAKLDLQKVVASPQSSKELKPYILKILKNLETLNKQTQQIQSQMKSETPKDPAPVIDDKDFVTIFNEAQRLKRQHKYRDARVLFEQVINNHTDKDNKTVKLAEDELIYGIPIFQVTSLQLDASSHKPEEINDRFRTIDSLLREILANNKYNIERSIAVNRKLDEVAISLHALDKALKAQATVSANNLRMLLRSEYAIQGEWPDKAFIVEQMQRYAHDLTLNDYQLKDHNITLVLKSARYNRTVTLKGDEHGEIVIE